MDTFPSSPPAAARADLTALRAVLDDSAIPPKRLDRSFLVATWNIRGFGEVPDRWDLAAGYSPRRDLRDVSAWPLQEVKRDPGGLRRLMEATTSKRDTALGPNWAWILTGFTRGAAGNQERIRPALQGSLATTQPTWRISDHYRLRASFSVQQS